jgi:hypothetical protein
VVQVVVCEDGVQGVVYRVCGCGYGHVCVGDVDWNQEAGWGDRRS